MTRGRARGVVARLRRDRRTFAALLALLALVLGCVLGPWVAAAFGHDATTMRYDLGSAPPSWAHWFGTDPQGRELLVRVLLGGRVALAIATSATVLAVAIGVSYGAVAAYLGGAVEALLMRVVDVLYGLPTLAVVIVVMALRDAHGLVWLTAILAAVSWLTLARVVRAQVRSLRQREFIVAARALGASPTRIVLRHLLPNTAGLVVVYATLALPQVMLAEAFLSFLGLGVQAPLASLGSLVTEGSAQLLVAPWMLAFPAGLMAALVLSLTFVGDGLRDALDPHDPHDPRAAQGPR